MCVPPYWRERNSCVCVCVHLFWNFIDNRTNFEYIINIAYRRWWWKSFYNNEVRRRRKYVLFSDLFNTCGLSNQYLPLRLSFPFRVHQFFIYVIIVWRRSRIRVYQLHNRNFRRRSITITWSTSRLIVYFYRCSALNSESKRF